MTGRSVSKKVAYGVAVLNEQQHALRAICNELFRRLNTNLTVNILT